MARFYHLGLQQLCGGPGTHYPSTPSACFPCSKCRVICSAAHGGTCRGLPVDTLSIHSTESHGLQTYRGPPIRAEVNVTRKAPRVGLARRWRCGRHCRATSGRQHTSHFHALTYSLIEHKDRPALQGQIPFTPHFGVSTARGTAVFDPSRARWASCRH